VDFVVELPKSSDFNAVIIVVDSISKSTYFILTYTTTITAEGTARLFLYYIWKLHGLLNHVVLDRNLQFVILFTQELYHFLEIEITLFMA